MSDWQPIETAPKCDLHPYDRRASEESAFVLVWNGFHVGVAYYQIDDDDFLNGGCWVSEAEEFISPEPTHWMPLPSPPKAQVQP